MSGSQSGRRPPANFTGNWLMDVKASDSLDPLLSYHGVAVTPVAALSVQNVVEVGSVTSPPALHGASSASHSELRVVTSSDGSHTAQISSETAALGLGGVAESLLKGQSVLGQSFLGSLSASPSSLSVPESPSFSASPAAAASVTPGTALASVAELPQESEVSAIAAEAASTTTATITAATTTSESDPASTSSVPSTTSSSSSTLPSATSPVALLSSTTALPALIVQHSTRRLTTYLHNLIPRYNESGALVRYDPVQTNSKLSVHEEYKIDGQYHVINTARGKVEARCYAAPHGQSVVVDTRCASKYDLERTERFLEDGGRTMVIEIRILSCAPELQSGNNNAPAASTKGVSKRFEDDASAGTNASKSSSPVKGSSSAAVAPNQVVVKEILFLRRVFRRIMDADPAAAAKAAAAAAVSTPPTPSSTVLLPAFGSGAATSRIEEEDSSASSSGFKGSKLDFDSEEVTSHHSPVKQRPVETAYQSTQSLPSFTSHMLTKEQQAAIAPSAITAGFTAAIGQQQSNVWSKIREAVMYPHVSIMRRYQLSELLVNDEPARNPQSTASLQTAVAAETKTLITARRTMLVVDVVLLVVVLLFLLVRFGVFSSDQLHDAISEGIEGVQQSAQAAAGRVKTEL